MNIPEHTIKICTTCSISKYENEFYKTRNSCIKCYNEKRKEIWYYQTCDRYYRKINKKHHQKSKVHEHCVKYNENFRYALIEHVMDCLKPKTDEIIIKIIEECLRNYIEEVMKPFKLFKVYEEEEDEK